MAPPHHSSRFRPAAVAPRRRRQTVADRGHFMKMQGQEVFRRAVRAIVESSTTDPRARRAGRERRRVVRPASGESTDHRGRGEAARFRTRTYDLEHRALRQHVGGVDTARAVRGGRGWPRPRRRPRTLRRCRRRSDLGQCAHPMGTLVSDPTERVAFVTGASQGIGRAIAIALARAGHPVGFCYASDADERRRDPPGRSSPKARRLSRCSATYPIRLRSTPRSERSRRRSVGSRSS